MAHLRIHLQPQTYELLRDISARTGRAPWVEAGLVLDAALRGVRLEDLPSLSSVAIEQAAQKAPRSADR